MSKTISLKKQIEGRWIYHFCKDNVPPADQNDEAERMRHRRRLRRQRPPTRRITAGSEDDDDNSENGDDNGVSNEDAYISDGDDDDDDDNGSDSSVEHDREDKKAIRVCIGFQFQKYETPSRPPRRPNQTQQVRAARREQQLVRVGKLNHRLASVLSAATRKTCLLDYVSICNYLLQSTANSSHVYTYRVFSRADTTRIDSLAWQQRQQASPDIPQAGPNEVYIDNDLRRILHRNVATSIYVDVGRQWILRQTSCDDDAKSVWARQNGLCAYCDVVTAPPDGEGVATCCPEYVDKIIHLSDTAKLQKMQQDANTELGQLVYDRILYNDKNVFLCLPCVKVHMAQQLQFSHSEELPVPSNIGNDDATLFFYFAACSKLHLVFSIFFCEVMLPVSPAVRACTTAAGGSGADGSAIDPQGRVVIMAYVTNLREAELVYIKVDESQLAEHRREQFRSGFTLKHPNFTAATVGPLFETSPDTTIAATTISSRYHIFHCIHDNQERRLVNFLQKRAPHTSVYAGRVFVYLCQCLYAGGPDIMAVNSAQVLWELLRDRLLHRYPDRTDISRDYNGFRSDTVTGQQHRNVFCENTVLLARRDTRDQLRQPHDAQHMTHLCLENDGNSHIMDSIVLLQNACPSGMLTLVQNSNQHHLYRLVAVCETDGIIMHWLDVENWNGIKTMPICDSHVLQWISTRRQQDNTPPRFRNIHRSFDQVRADLLNTRVHAHVERTAAIEAAGYVCFYQRLTRSQDKAHAVPISLSSPIARRLTHSLRQLFGAHSQIIPMALAAAAASINVTAALQRHSLPVFDISTQRCVRTMAVAIKLMGFIAVSELHACFQLLPVHPQQCHVFVFLLWNKFVMLEGFDAKTECVHMGAVLGREVGSFGDMDLDAVLTRFRLFLDRQCIALYASRPDNIRNAFVNTQSLLRDFNLVLHRQHPCSTARHAIRSLKTFETRLAPPNDQDNYPLGNTKLMLHYFSCVLGFTVLELYLSCIRDTLV